QKMSNVSSTVYTHSPFKFQHNSRPEPGDTEQVTNDEANLHRVWERSHAEYANMSTVAGPIGDPIQPNDDMPDYQRAFAEPALSVTNTLLSPVIFVMYPPWSEVVYRGDAYAPTYTGNGFAQIAGNATSSEVNGATGATGGYSGYETNTGNATGT